MRRIELLIPVVRRMTENERVGSTDGISDEDFLEAFTQGQKLLQRRICVGNNAVFRTSTTFDANGTERYSNLPWDILLRNRTVSLEYSSTGRAQDYQNVLKRTQHERWSYQGYPSRYFMEGEDILVNAYPVMGSFRRVYNYKLPRLDKRRTTVASFTASATALTALTLATAAPFDAEDYALDDHLTLVDANGNVKMRGIPYTAVNSGTGVVSILDSSYTFPEGSTISNGLYVCLGEYSSTHSKLDDQCEDFLVTYCSKRILMRDSSQDVGDLESILEPQIQDLLELYTEDPDIQQVPETNDAYFTDLG